MKTDPIEALSAIREQLREAARYTESDPMTCKAIIEQVDRDSYGYESALNFSGADRLIDNLRIGRDSLMVDPEVARCYLYCAVYELGCIRSELERAENREREATT